MYIYFFKNTILHSIYIYICITKLYSIMDFRQSIKDICQEKGMTQKDLAEKLGITDISLNKTLRGAYPQLQTLEKIAGVLNVPITDLFEKPIIKGESDFHCPKCGTSLEIKEKE